MNQKIKTIYQDYLFQFEKEGIAVSRKSLQKLIAKETLKAKKNYSILTEPKTCSLSTYVALWVREILDQKFVLKGLRKINLNNPGQDPYAQAAASFFYFLPLELIPYLQKEIFTAPFSKRQKIWQDFNLPIKDIEDKFQYLVRARGKEQLERGFSFPWQGSLRKNKIPLKDYWQFTENIDRLIILLNQKLSCFKNLPTWFYDEFNLPCFICQLPSFPFSSLEEVFDFFAKEYPIIAKFRQKIKIEPEKENSSTIYRRKKDIFVISIGEGSNIRHQTMSLIHELSHVASLLTSLNEEKDLVFIGGKYQAEKEAIKIETRLLKKISSKLYFAHLGDVLLFPFRSTLFEIDLYQNPDQKPSRLYAQSFNRCFLKAKQKNNPLYLLDKRIISGPFSYLCHALARYQVLSKGTF